MHTYKVLLAFCALAIVMLVGCKQPVGLPNYDVRAATIRTTYCYVAGDTAMCGHVDWYQTYNMGQYYVRTVPLIKRGYTDSAGLQHPRMNGFCTFAVPYFDSHGEIPQCTLFYYQSAHNGSADLRVNWLSSITTWPVSDGSLFWAAWDDEPIMATDVAQGTDGWHSVPLTSEGSGKVLDKAGQILRTGWTYRGSVSGTYANVTGSGANAPYIKVVYDDGQ